jgi:hypothetical protein
LLHYQEGKIAIRLKRRGEKKLYKKAREKLTGISRVSISDTATTPYFVVISVRNYGVNVHFYFESGKCSFLFRVVNLNSILSLVVDTTSLPSKNNFRLFIA